MWNPSARWALVIAAVCSLAAGAAPAEPGLIARWTFDEGRGDVARDVSGHGHDAKLRNVTWVPSPRRGALRFQSRDSLADYAGLETMNLSGDLTLAVWVKADGAVQANHHRLIFGDVGLGIERNLHLSLDNYQRLSFEWADGRRNASLLAPASLLNGAWRQVVVVADSRALRARLFVDGEVVAEMDMPLPISHAPAKGRITGWFYDGYFQGELDDIRLYSRALSTAEVTALFNAEADLQVGGATLLYDGLGERPSGVSSVRLRNRGRQPRRVQLSGDLPARDLTLAPGAEAEVAVGRVPLEPVWSRRSDLFVAGGTTPASRLAVTTAHDGRDDRQQITTAGQLVLEPLRVQVADPWQRDLALGKTGRVTVDVQLLLPAEQLRQGTLRLALASREGGREVLSQQVTAPQSAARFELDTQALPWGAYGLTVSFQNGAGRAAVSTRRTATVLPGGAQQIRVLNNLVSELMDARPRGLLKSRRIEFMNPRDGWVWFSAAGAGALRLGDEPLLTAAAGQPAAEAMRLLPAGRHALLVNGTLTDVVVRAIPALVYNVYPSISQITPFGANTWARLKRYTLPNCNMIEGQVIDTPEHREWLAQGKLWIANAQAPGLIDKEVWTPEKMLDFWRRPRGWDLARLGGIQSDEYYPGLSTEMILTTARSVARLSEDPAFAGKLWIPFVVAMYGNELAELFMKTTIGAGWPFSIEVYEGELPTEAANLANLRGRFRSVATAWDRAYPGAVRRTIFTPMYAYLPYCTTNRCPQADFRVHLEQQMQVLATDPAYFGLWGVQPYRSNYVDEEILNAMGRLLRHYCVEGRTDRLLSDPYELRHLTDPDFEAGGQGWQLTGAEEGSLSPGRLTGYGNLQGRYPGGAYGDAFLLLTRSAKRPNLVRQTIRGLQAGRLYSLKVITGDYSDLKAGRSRQDRQMLSITIAGAEVQPGAFSHPYRSAGGRKPFTAQAPYWLTYHWLQFRATGPTAELTLSDWARPDAPGAPVGQQVMVNFVELQPVLTSE